MATPCKKCGATGTEAVHHGLTYKLIKKFGYRLRKCSRCRRTRLLPLAENPGSEREGHHHHHQESAPVEAVPNEAEELHEKERREACPKCGKHDFRRSRRTWWEHLRRRPSMVRCRSCRHRYALPREPQQLA